MVVDFRGESCGSLWVGPEGNIKKKKATAVLLAWVEVTQILHFKRMFRFVRISICCLFDFISFLILKVQIMGRSIAIWGETAKNLQESCLRIVDS